MDGALVGAGSVWPKRSIPCLGHTHCTGTTMVETRNPKILGVCFYRVLVRYIESESGINSGMNTDIKIPNQSGGYDLSLVSA